MPNYSVPAIPLFRKAQMFAASLNMPFAKWQDQKIAIATYQLIYKAIKTI
jgi:hypothetical protein